MQSTDSTCDALNIPVHLHCMEKPIDAVFDPAEELYMRFPSSALDAGKIPMAFKSYRVENQSVNRQKYSRLPDVLYNIASSTHYSISEHAVVVFNVSDIVGVDYPNENTPVFDDAGKEVGKGAIFSLRVEHRPERCMYPHSEIVLYRDGEPNQGRKIPESTKTLIRSNLRKRLNLRPDSVRYHAA